MPLCSRSRSPARGGGNHRRPQLALTGARARGVDWLAGLPFPVENLNAVLNGLGETLEITFRDAAPAPGALSAGLDRVSPECFVTSGGGAGDAPAGDPRCMEVRIGVVDSKQNPSGSNHTRYRRVQALVSEVLAPLADKHPIAEVRVK
jgi:hypothetical protein